jgi:hypothetical protein
MQEANEKKIRLRPPGIDSKIDFKISPDREQISTQMPEICDVFALLLKLRRSNAGFHGKFHQQLR